MAKAEIMVTGHEEGLLRIEARLAQMQQRMTTTRQHTAGLADEFEKIPRRMIVAGGAALAFGATIGTIRDFFASWNAELDKTKDKMLNLMPILRDYLSLLPKEERAAAATSLREEALVSPLKLEDVSRIRGEVRSIRGITTAATDQERQNIERAAQAFQLVRNIPGPQAARAIATARNVWPQGPTEQGWANMYNVLFTESGYTAENLYEFLEQTAKGMMPGEVAGAEPAHIMAMLVKASRGGEAPSRAAMGVGMMIQKLYDPDMARKMGMSPAAWRKKSLRERLSAVSGRAKTLEDYMAIYGERVGARAAYQLSTPEARAETATVESILQAAAARPGADIQTEYDWMIANNPEFRAEMEMARQVEIPELKALHPVRRAEASLKERRAAFRDIVSGPGVGGWLTRRTLQAAYGAGYVMHGFRSEWGTQTMLGAAAQLRALETWAPGWPEVVPETGRAWEAARTGAGAAPTILGTSGSPQAPAREGGRVINPRPVHDLEGD